MNVCRFVGRHTVIGDREFSEFGQKIELTPERFAEISKSAAFIPEADFAALELPADDLVKYGSVHYYGAKPQSFMDGVERAREIYRASHAALHT